MSDSCIEPGCHRDKGKAHGLCNAHYAQRQRAGTLPRRTPEAERFWSKVNKTDTCWLWIGAIDHGGYGTFGASAGHSRRAHRWAYEAANGPIPEGLHIDHLCRVRNCVNPDHLEVVTLAENTRRGIGGWNLTNGDLCRNGLHPWPESAREYRDGWARCEECIKASLSKRKQRATNA